MTVLKYTLCILTQRKNRKDIYDNFWVESTYMFNFSSKWNGKKWVWRYAGAFQTLSIASVISNQYIDYSLAHGLMMFVPGGLINNIPALAQIMAWRQAVIWTNDGLGCWRIYAPLLLNELTVISLVMDESKPHRLYKDGKQIFSTQLI